MYQSFTSIGFELIKRSHRFGPTFGARLSNHLPMALSAMQRLGASTDQLNAEYLRASGHLSPLGDALGIEHPMLGEKAHNADFVEYYRTMLSEIGTEQTLKTVLPTLLPGVSAGAFHGVIRLAYAVELGDIDETSHALAYWSSGYTPLGDLSFQQNLSTEEDLNQALSIFHDQTYREGIIIDHVEELITLPTYSTIASQPDSLSLNEVARIVLSQYSASNDFTLLHGVTGFQALVSLFPFIENHDLALHYFWQAYVAASCTAAYRKPFQHQIQEHAPRDILDWSYWFERALETEDDHTIKLTYSCARLYDHLRLPEAISAIKYRLETSS
ncbi:questin oxidase family protein [Enterovibrio sp. ZSDZ42]|uniref:Questin oxidase family protein n=1 Tax=Enterovibrio gelatinilyticus TaxID=2899819 RepID=A0ABT5R1M8_9GAMM|nr:questin oxidase family protein [Enterovibrio sp. ZSDZ42]MDD1794179.1 questin oxidase family protein [Enterovibrio sp. ZSDZ42]